MTAIRGRDAAPPRGARTAQVTGCGALIACAAGTALLGLVMALGPSAAVPRLGPGAPIWSVAARPAAGTVITLERAGLLLGALGVVFGLAAVSRGWRPPAGLLLGAGAVVAAAFVFLPPAGSIDVLNYAIYGRIASLGHNPYLMRPAELYGTGDPVGLFAPLNWRSLPTLYGPVATAAQWAAATLGGASMARIVFWIRLGNAIAYVATAVMLVRLAGREPARRARVCMLWAVNPLMLFWLVGSGHVDVLLALLAVAALVTIRSSGVAAGVVTGVLAGAATAVKTPFALAAAGLAAAARRSPRTLAAGAAGAAAVLVPSYLLPGALNAGVLGRRLTVSAGFIYPVPAFVAARPAVFAVIVLLAALALGLLLVWRLPAGPSVMPAVRLMLAASLAWLAVFPVQAPWYDALLFPLLALMPASRLDYLLVTRCFLLGEMLLPGVLPNSGRLSVVAARLSHIGLLVLLGILVLMCVFAAWGGDKENRGSEHGRGKDSNGQDGDGQDGDGQDGDGQDGDGQDGDGQDGDGLRVQDIRDTGTAGNGPHIPAQRR
jgi:alpha-1,6-mannosyltransferase